MVQALSVLADVQQKQAQVLAVHSDKLDRIETALFEMTAKVNFLIDREMRREGGPEANA